MSTVVVVGADKGIGRALAEQYAGRGDQVVAACLGVSIFNGARIEICAPMDVTSDGDVAMMARRLDGRSVHTLLYVAGIVLDSPLGAFDFEAMKREYDVNAIGVLRVVQTLLPNIVAGGKIGILTSRVASLSENESGGLYSYRMSKAAANMAGLCLARELKAREISVMCLHPGTVRTDLTAKLVDSPTLGSMAEPADAAAGLIARMDELLPSSSGSFRHANGQVLPW